MEADLKQLDVLFGLHRQFSTAIDTREMAKVELADRLREELDYAHEAKNAALYAGILEGQRARCGCRKVHQPTSRRAAC